MAELARGDGRRAGEGPPRRRNVPPGRGHRNQEANGRVTRMITGDSYADRVRDR